MPPTVAFAITSLAGLPLAPTLMSRAARINSSWIWGVWGTILVVPVLMMINAVCDHIEDRQPIGEFLGE